MLRDDIQFVTTEGNDRKVRRIIIDLVSIIILSCFGQGNLFNYFLMSYMVGCYM